MKDKSRLLTEEVIKEICDNEVLYHENITVKKISVTDICLPAGVKAGLQWQPVTKWSRQTRTGDSAK